VGTNKIYTNLIKKTLLQNVHSSSYSSVHDIHIIVSKEKVVCEMMTAFGTHIVIATTTTISKAFYPLHHGRRGGGGPSSTNSTRKCIHLLSVTNVANSFCGQLRRRRIEQQQQQQQQRRRHRDRALETRSSSDNENTVTNTKGKMLKWSDIDEKTKELPDASVAKKMQITGVHHVAIIVKDMQRTMDFYQGILGLAINPARPKDKLPYDGAWLWIGDEMIHIMELPNPDPDDIESRPTHGGRDRHFCIGCMDIQPLMDALDANKIEYTKSKSGRPAIFFRDPDSNTLEVVEGLEWRV